MTGMGGTGGLGGTEGSEDPDGVGGRVRRDQGVQPWPRAVGPGLRAAGSGLRAVGLGLRGRAWEVTRGVRQRTVLGLALLSLGLLAVGLGTSAAPFLWGLTGGWALALAIALAVLRACADGRGEEP